jgi:L-serine dehydratase
MKVVLDRDGSFAGTFGVMAEDRAMVAGVLGLPPDDERLFRAFELALDLGMTIDFEFSEISESDHPNAMKFVLTAPDGQVATLVGTSTGGGMIETLLVDGFPLRGIGDAYVLLLFEEAEEIDAGIQEAFSHDMHGFLDSETIVAVGAASRLHALRFSDLPHLESIRAELVGRAFRGRIVLLRPVLPVVAHPGRQAQLFDTMVKWRELADQEEAPLWEIAIRYEVAASGWSREDVKKRMVELARLMHRQTNAAYEADVSVPTGQFKPDFTGRWSSHERTGRTLTDPITAHTIRLAYGAGAGIPGVVTVPGPMGGGGGYVYAALSAVKEARGFGDEDLLHGLLVAAGVGAIAFTRTEPTGEVIGCTGEAGVCGAMAAAGIVEMAGGTGKQAEDAASLALQAFIGMPCDPMPGGLCQPCRSRVLAATCMAHVFADLAIAGHEAVLPFHEALDVADDIGRKLDPGLLCTSKGGACAAPEARRRRAGYEAWVAQSRPEERPPGNLI